MLATIRDDTWNVLHMQHIILNTKRWDYWVIPVVAINRLKDLPTWLKVATTLEKPPTPTHEVNIRKIKIMISHRNLKENMFNIVVSSVLADDQHCWVPGNSQAQWWPNLGPVYIQRTCSFRLNQHLSPTRIFWKMLCGHAGINLYMSQPMRDDVTM